MFGVSPVTVADVVAEVATTWLPFSTRYPVTPTLSVAAGQSSFTELPVMADATGAPGAVGGCVSGTPPPNWTSEQL